MRVLAIVFALLAPYLLGAGTAGAAVTFTLVGDRTGLSTGDTLTVGVEVPVAGDGFNGYDAVLNFDATLLEPLLPNPRSAGEGPLFTEACGLRFLDVSDDGDSTRVRVSHVVLCAGLSVTGPGRTYTLAFRALASSGVATIGLNEETQAYDAGFLVDTERGAPLQIQVNGATTAPALPHQTGLRVVPNPFNPSTELRAELVAPGPVALVIHDAAGRIVRRLFDGRLTAGQHRLRWDGRDDAGRAVASGTYFARLRTARDAVAARLVLLR